MAIAALVLTSLTAFVASWIKSTEEKESKGQVELLRDRVIGFALINNRLPAYATGAGTDELSNLNAQGRDFWGRKIRYAYDPELVRTDSTALICAKKTTNLAVRYCGDVDCTAPTTQSNVAFLMFSSGRNLINQTGTSPSPHTETASRDDSESGPGAAAGAVTTISIFTNGTSVGKYSSPTVSPTEYDDMVYAITLEDLRNKLSCQGASLKIVNNDLPTGAANTAYLSTIHPDGGVPVTGNAAGSYRWCAESTTVGTAAPLSGVVATEVITARGTASSLVLAATGGCAAALERAWIVGNNFRIRGSGVSNALNTTSAGTYDITVYVRDDQNPDAAVSGTTDSNDNIVFKKFVLGVNGT
jgi:hypothetical protein